MNDGGRLQAWLAMAPADRPSDELLLVDHLGLDAAGRIDLLTLLDQQERLLQAAKVRVLAEIDRADDTELTLSQEAVSLALRVPRGAATSQLKTARTLVDQLPATLSGLTAGKFSVRHAEAVAERSWRLEPETVPVWEAAVLASAADKTFPDFRRDLNREENRLEPGKAEARHQHALTERKVSFQALDDGMAALPVVLDAPDAQSVFTRLTAAARLFPKEDQRNVDQKRADLLVDAVLTGISEDALPEMQGRKPTVQVTVSADTLLNLNDEPGDLSGYGPVTADTVRRMAADQSGTWRRLLTDPDTGHLLDLGAKHYRPAQRLRDFVTARDGVCCFPGCNQPGYRCEYEHTVPFGPQGQTCRCNGALACKRHNLCKINTGWGYTHNDDGSFTWRTDTGHTYTSHPPQRWRRPTDPPAPQRPQKTQAEVWAKEDADYTDLILHWHTELRSAHQAHDQPRATNAEQALTRARQQRKRQQAHRKDNNIPPF